MSEYRTISGYTRQEANPLTHTMEDYLEMICRLSRETGFVRVHQLAETLHVKPSSVTKMAKQLQQQGRENTCYTAIMCFFDSCAW